MKNVVLITTGHEKVVNDHIFCLILQLSTRNLFEQRIKHFEYVPPSDWIKYPLEYSISLVSLFIILIFVNYWIGLNITEQRIYTLICNNQQIFTNSEDKSKCDGRNCVRITNNAKHLMKSTEQCTTDEAKLCSYVWVCAYSLYRSQMVLMTMCGSFVCMYEFSLRYMHIRHRRYRYRKRIFFSLYCRLWTTIASMQEL